MGCYGSVQDSLLQALCYLPVQRLKGFRRTRLATVKMSRLQKLTPHLFAPKPCPPGR